MKNQCLMQNEQMKYLFLYYVDRSWCNADGCSISYVFVNMHYLGDRTLIHLTVIEPFYLILTFKHKITIVYIKNRVSLTSAGLFFSIF